MKWCWFLALMERMMTGEYMHRGKRVDHNEIYSTHRQADDPDDICIRGVREKERLVTSFIDMEARQVGAGAEDYSDESDDEDVAVGYRSQRYV